jgi:hypothetical protein
MREMFEMFYYKSEHKRIVIARNTCICKVAIHAIALILCLLFRCTLPQHFHLLGVWLELSDVEHLLSLLDETIMARMAAKVKPLVPLLQLAAGQGSSTLEPATWAGSTPVLSKP